MLMMSLCHQFYLSRNQVHEEKSKHYITIFNEMMGVSFYIYGLMALQINENDKSEDIIGWYLTFIITGVVAINVVYTFVMTIKNAVKRFQKQRRLSMKARKDIIQQEQPKEEEKIKEEEEKKPKLREDSTFLD